jgi:autotransporter strand-loop-strand O-heptosyltransferase
MVKIFGHGSYVGNTGYNQHTRDFFRHLSKHAQIKFRNFTVGSTWEGFNKTPHDNEPYINEVDKELLYEQILWNGDRTRSNHKMYIDDSKEFSPDVNIVLSETNHHIFYDTYYGPKIAYNVWESTLQPSSYFEELKKFDEFWVPSKWQKECTIKQGYDPEKIKIVPEGVDVYTFFPETVEPLDEYNDGRFKFLLFGRWDYRKSTKEIIEWFLKTFSEDEPVDLVVSIDNMWGEHLDGFKTTEERLEHYGLNHSRIKIVHFPKREDYIKYLKTGHVFLSCARSEGWNLPLIEAMACGTPSIYSNCSGQLEFAEGKGFPVNILYETPADTDSYARYKMSELPGNYYEPDFNELSKVMRHVYENYDECKIKSLKESEEIRKNFNWEHIAEIGINTINEFLERQPKEDLVNLINITYLDGPRVEIKGNNPKEYFIEFIDGEGNVRYSDTIKNNMWTACGIKYYVPWTIKVNGQVVSKLDLKDKKVLISFESSSIGDTFAWAPYAIELMKKRGCKVILSTFHNEWFEGSDVYKDITFINPGDSINCDVTYRLGWFKNSEGSWKNHQLHPEQPNLIPLQKCATDILGLEYKEVNHGLNYTPGKRPLKSKYVVFGPQSTAGCKEWPLNYWKELSKMIRDLGYEVVILSLNDYFIDGTINNTTKDWSKIFDCLYYSEFFIGLSSGLSWANWSLNKQTVMIAGFSKNDHEFNNNIIRVSNDICIKCWNDPVLVFDKSDWDWCPVYKGTTRQHICQKSITAEMVINKIQHLVN